MSLPFQVDQEVKDNFKPPHLRFEDASIKDNAASLAAGRAVYHPCVKVYIRSPGDDKCEVPYEVEKKVTNSLTGVEETIFPWEIHLKEKLHHQFISRQYFDFCMKSVAHWEKNRETLVDGTPISEWPLLTKAECDNLKSLGILSVEQCSQMTEEAMMAYGMGGRTIKDKAGNWLGANSNPGQAAEKINALESSLGTITAKAEEAMNMASMYQAKIAQLEDMILNKSGPKDVPEITTTLSVDYDLMTDGDLLAAVKPAFPMAHKGWSRDTLIGKLRA